MIGLDRMVKDSSDKTPIATRLILIAALAITAVIHALLAGEWIDFSDSAAIAPVLWLFTGLFVLRVAGQVLVALQPQGWLPPMGQWNFVPYSILLPVQLVFIAFMVWIDLSFSMTSGVMTVREPGAGNFLIIFSAGYALAMVIRYVRRMSIHPDQRWFGGTIPIVFHVVLASYLYVIGLYHVSV